MTVEVVEGENNRNVMAVGAGRGKTIEMWWQWTGAGGKQHKCDGGGGGGDGVSRQNNAMILTWSRKTLITLPRNEKGKENDIVIHRKTI